MANIFSRPFVTLGRPEFDDPSSPRGQRFTASFEPGDQVWYHLADGRVIKDTGITGTPNPPTQYGTAGNLVDVIRADYRDKHSISKQTWLKIDNGRLPLPPEDFDGRPYTNALFNHCYDPLSETAVTLSNGRDSSLTLSPPTAPSMLSLIHI